MNTEMAGTQESREEGYTAKTPSAPSFIMHCKSVVCGLCNAFTMILFQPDNEQGDIR